MFQQLLQPQHHLPFYQLTHLLKSNVLADVNLAKGIGNVARKSAIGRKGFAGSKSYDYESACLLVLKNGKFVLHILLYCISSFLTQINFRLRVIFSQESMQAKTE